MKILNFGSLNYDKVYEVEHFVKPKESLLVKKQETFLGGKGFNQSVSLAKAGCDVIHAGMIGEDGHLLIEYLEKCGVNINLIKKCDVESGHAIIQVCNGENSILVYGGANHCITVDMIDFVLSYFSKDDVLLIQNEISNVEILILKAHKKGMKIIFNPSPFTEQVLKYPLNLVDMFILNEIEGKQLVNMETNDYHKIMKEISFHYPLAEIVMTVGSDGVYYHSKDINLHQIAYSTKVVDTTGAGDTFTGFYIASILKGYSVSQSLKIACKASSISIGKKGAAVSIPTWEIVKNEMK